jgi:adenine-specific DNA glycosylase
MPRRPLYCATVLLTDSIGRHLVEPRDARGLWASMWQAPTLESSHVPDSDALRAWLGPLTLRPHFTFAHGTTHRNVVFHIWHAPHLPLAAAKRLSRSRPTAEWLTPAAINNLPLSNPQRRILLTPLP